MDPKYCIVYCTCPVDPKVTDDIAQDLLSNKLAACVNIINQVQSIYTWNGKLTNGTENLLMIKTKLALLPQVEQHIIKLHPYNCPEIIAVPIMACSQPYADWIDSSVN